jgi:Protein of unknown function (DUF2800)
LAEDRVYRQQATVGEGEEMNIKEPKKFMTDEQMAVIVATGENTSIRNEPINANTAVHRHHRACWTSDMGGGLPALRDVEDRMIHYDEKGELFGWTDERLGLPSASEMSRNKACPGNRTLAHALRDKGWLRKESSPEATLGERIHASLEGEPEELERKAKDVRDSCESLCLKAVNQFFEGEAYDVVYEQRIWYSIQGTPYFSARPDRVYFNKDRILYPDFKTGPGDTEEAGVNTQLRAGVAILGSCYPEVERIGVAIIQPLVTHTPEIAVYDRAAIQEATLEILEIVDQTFWSEERKAGSHCKFCVCRPFCPEARQLAIDHPLTINVEALPRGEQGAALMDRIKVARKILDAVEHEYKAIVEKDSNSLPGWWISEGRKIRYVNSWRAIEKLIEERNPAFVEPFENLLSLPLGKLEDFAEQHGIHMDEFKDFISTKRTSGALEKIPKKYLGSGKPRSGQVGSG